MHKVIGDEEGIKGAFSHLVKIQVMLLLGICLLCKAIYLCQRGSHDIIDCAAHGSQFIDVVKAADFHHVITILQTA